MEIKIDNKAFSFGRNRFTYNLYYFDSEKYGAPTLGGVFKKVLIEWAHALENISGQNVSFFLPYAPDDQETECLKLSPLHERFVVERVTVKESGFNINIDNLEEFITAPHEIYAESAEVLGEFDRRELVSALRNAQIVGG
jgi:hypothetical protein